MLYDVCLSPVRNPTRSDYLRFRDEAERVVADLRYSFGLTDLHKNKDEGIDGYSSAHNRVLTFTLGYKFP